MANQPLEGVALHLDLVARAAYARAAELRLLSPGDAVYVDAEGKRVVDARTLLSLFERAIPGLPEEIRSWATQAIVQARAALVAHPTKTLVFVAVEEGVWTTLLPDDNSPAAN